MAINQPTGLWCKPYQIISKMSSKEQYQLVGRSMVSENGSFRIIKSWYAGWWPELGGKLINGWSGKETEVEGEVIKPIKIVEVKDGKIDR